MADDVFLQPLAGKFIKLVLQLLARYHTWLERGLAQRATHDPQAGAEQVWSPSICIRNAQRLAGAEHCCLPAVRLMHLAEAGHI